MQLCINYFYWVFSFPLQFITRYGIQFPVRYIESRTLLMLMCVCIYIYIYIYKLNHFAIKQKLTQHCKSTTFQKKKEKMLISLEPPQGTPAPGPFSKRSFHVSIRMQHWHERDHAQDGPSSSCPFHTHGCVYVLRPKRLWAACGPCGWAMMLHNQCALFSQRPETQRLRSRDVVLKDGDVPAHPGRHCLLK